MKDLITKDGAFYSWPSGMNTFARLVKVGISKGAKTPYSRVGADGSLYEILTPVPTTPPHNDVVVEIVPILVGRNWIQQWSERAFTTDELESYRENARLQVIERQYKVADQGLILPSSEYQSTTDDSVTSLTAALHGNKRNPSRVRKVNSRNTRTVADNTALEATLDIIDDHRQESIDRGYDLVVELEAALDKDAIDLIMEVDFNEGWPLPPETDPAPAPTR